MKASEYKKLKGLRKESLRDNMTDIEVALTDLGEIATREIAKKRRPQGLEENKKIAKIGGNIAKNTRDNLEKELEESVIKKENNLPYKYINNKMLKENNLNNDELLFAIAEFCVAGNACSINAIQNNFGLGFNRAQRIVQLLEEKQIVSPKCGTKPREILVDDYKLREIFGVNE